MPIPLDLTEDVMDQKALRKELRNRRQSLSKAKQLDARKQLAATVCSLPVFQKSTHIALYLTNDGEIDPADIAVEAWRQNKTCYLPVLDQIHKGMMYFLPYRPDTPMQNNQYGIPEPMLPDSQICRAENLDLVLMPLTGFDEKGNRMGMGGGYYDRTFSFKQAKPQQHPILIGLAHECQKVRELAVNPWDIPLAGVASPQRFYQ